MNLGKSCQHNNITNAVVMPKITSTLLVPYTHIIQWEIQGGSMEPHPLAEEFIPPYKQTFVLIKFHEPLIC